MIPLFKVALDPDICVKNLFNSGYVGQGKYVEEFELALKSWIGDKVLTVNGATSALQLALRLSDVGYGDYVISSPMTCTATNMPILAMGAKILWADINPNTGNIDYASVTELLVKHPYVKAIIATHWGGYPCELKRLANIGTNCNVKLIQDAAHAFGAKFDGHNLSRYGDFTCFSFQAIKHLTCVDGGALVCGNEDDYKRGKLLRWYGIDRETNSKSFRCEADIKEFGYKFNMNDLNALIGLKNLKNISHILTAHIQNAYLYNNAFKNLKRIKLPVYDSKDTCVYWLYTIFVDKLQDFMDFMKEKEVMVSQVHARNDKHTCFKEFETKLPGVDEFYKKQVAIPVGWWLSKEQVDYIIECIREYDNG